MRTRNWTGRSVAVLLAAAALVGPSRAVAGEAKPTSAPPPLEDGAAAPVGCWTTVGGCPARTASSLTPPVVGPVAAAWDLAVKGEIESEPLVWDGTVIVESRDKDDARSLTAVALSTGKVLGRKTWRGAPPLLPNVWGGAVVVRTTPTRVEGLRLRRDGFQSAWTLDLPDAVHDLLLFRREVYVRVGEGLARYELGAHAPTWTATEGLCRGRLALRGRQVYCVVYDGPGNAELDTWSRADGKVHRGGFIGCHDGGRPGVEAGEPRVQAFARAVRVLCDTPLKTSGGGTASLAEVERVVYDGDALLLKAGLSQAVGEAAEWPGGWIGAMTAKSGAKELWATEADDRHWIFATEATHPAFLQPAVPPVTAGGYGYFGATAAELATRRIAWSVDAKPRFRCVPARDALLVVGADGRLTAYRPQRAAEAAATVLASASDAAVQGRVVLRDGTVLVGAVRVKAGSPAAVDGRSAPLEDVALAEDASGAILAAAPNGAAVAALDALLTRDAGQAYASLAAQAIATHDSVLMRRLAAAAVADGADAAQVARVEKELKELAARPKPPPVNAAESARIAAAERDVAAGSARAYWDRCRRLPPDAPRTLVLDLLDAAFARDPSLADAAKSVRAMLPTGIVPPEPFDARDWISFVRALEFTPVTLVKPPTPNAPDLSPGERVYGMYLKVWRPDLVALQSKQLLVISAPAAPGRIANCLSAGELVCDALESFFASGRHVRDKRWPMTILLFEDRAEYLRVLARQRAGEDEQRMLEWSVGEYDPGVGSEMYLPRDEEGFRLVLRTFVHELTHQWLAERCPLYAAGEGVVVHRGGGHFVVEGFARMVEEMNFDLVRRTWGFDPEAESLDVVASAAPGTLLPWTKFLGFDHHDFSSLSHEYVIPVRPRRCLEGELKVSEGDLFYDQGAAVCHCLFQADGGKLRQALLEYAAAYYAGRTPTIKAAFGMDEEELGRRVLAFARAPDGK